MRHFKLHRKVRMFTPRAIPAKVPTLETRRLLLRPWKPTDDEDFYAYAKDPRVGPAAGWAPHTSLAQTRTVLERYFMGPDMAFALELKATHRVIGSVALRQDHRRPGLYSRALGYALSPDYWGQGLMPEAVGKIIGYLFAHTPVEILSIYCTDSNARSRKVALKCGFTYEGTLRMGSRRYDGKFLNEECYSLLRSEFEGRKNG